MWDEGYTPPPELIHTNPFAKKVAKLGNKQGKLRVEDLLPIIEEMGEHIGKLEAKISRLEHTREE